MYILFRRQCSAAILDAVDNYAVLCLDIVWCYLCLKNVEDLPDAGIVTEINFLEWNSIMCKIQLFTLLEFTHL